MKRTKLAMALAIISILAAGNALAAGSATVSVSAAVLASCSLDASTYNLAFGDIDPALTGAKTATADLTIACNGADWTLTGASHTDKAMTGPGTLTYSVTPSATSGTGLGGTVTLNASIAQTVYQAALAGSYTDSFTISVNP
jgi:hypothetical protein